MQIVLEHIIGRRLKVLKDLEKAVKHKAHLTLQLNAIHALEGEDKFKLACYTYLGQRMQTDELIHNLEAEATELDIAKQTIRADEERIRYYLIQSRFNIIHSHPSTLPRKKIEDSLKKTQ